MTLLALALVLAQSPALEVRLVATGPLACDPKAPRIDHGWLGLTRKVQALDELAATITWELTRLHTARDGGAGALCATEEVWLFVAFKGKRLEPHPVEVVELGAEACVLQGRSGKKWNVAVGTEGVTVSGEKKVTFALGGGCWAKAAVADLDRDGVPDLVAQRADGSVGVWLSRGVKGAVPMTGGASER
ncbi:MAG: hypothetical protein U0228_26430 [Myxococcaceae bacterium]